jgi:hypothetical protein
MVRTNSLSDNRVDVPAELKTPSLNVIVAVVLSALTANALAILGGMVIYHHYIIKYT